jgi:hypothetical protein
MRDDVACIPAVPTGNQRLGPRQANFQIDLPHVDPSFLAGEEPVREQALRLVETFGFRERAGQPVHQRGRHGIVIGM